MGPRTERSAGHRTFLLLMLIAVVLFGVHFESDCNGFKFASVSAGPRSVESAPFCFPIAPTTRNLRAVMCVYRPIGLQ